MDDFQAEVSRQWDLGVELITRVAEALSSGGRESVRAFCATMLERGLDVGVIFASYHQLDASCLPRLLAIDRFEGGCKGVAATLKGQMQQLLETVVEEGLNESPAGIQACYYFAAAEMFAEFLEGDGSLDAQEFLVCMQEVPIVFLKWCAEDAGTVRDMMEDDRHSMGEILAAVESGDGEEHRKLRMRLAHYRSILLYRHEEFAGGSTS